MLIGFCTVESTYDHIFKAKSIGSLGILNLHITLDKPPINLSNMEKSEIINFNKEIKANSMVEAFGGFTNGYIQSDLSNMPDKAFQNINITGIDKELLKIYNFKLNNSKNLKELVESSDKTEYLQAIVGKNIAKQLPAGSTKTVCFTYVDDLVRFKIKNVGIINSNTAFWNTVGNSSVISDNIQKLDDSIIVVLPEGNNSLYLNTIDKNFLIKLKNINDKNKYVSFVQRKFSKHKLVGSIHDIDYEIDNYKKRNQIPIFFSLGFSFLILILASFGLTGVILSSILRRRTEFGIRYALGATPKTLSYLIIGETMFLFLIGNVLGIVFSTLISIAIKQITLGPFAILASTITMFIFAFISSLIPAIQITRTEPIKLIYKRWD
jgi:putative ABC transport system permease protein